MSYSLYLVHWPVFAFLNNAAVRQASYLHHIGALLLAVGPGAASVPFVEQPTRRLELRPSRRLVISGLAASMLVTLLPFVVSQAPTSAPD